ncbi:uncharacterized protein LOC130572003 isoform X3 [Triplophysa rosa]|uniref:uncharacterized protein LOC130572003 isoform X3 n=1 Tax=Triplophysa rosa TaxID=992332 RepID=UPI002546249C|nr:uncharacterized protein LOC130572003 isoform X3 [Triplophysa rosa]XP_057219380.1 uncharacterized protein LOC130572003 isoform X3 [Triplophysa rosa]
MFDNTEDVDPSEEPSSSFQGCRKRKSNVLAEQNAECSEADKKMESNKVSKKKCIKCNMAIGVATKVCKACGEAQPMRRKLQKKIKKYDEAWASAPMENGKLNNLFDETNLLLHKWQLLGMYPLFLLGGKRRSKTVTQCLCPIKFKHPQNKEAQDTMRQIFVRLINAQQTALEPIVTKAPAQPPAPQLQLIQPQRALQPVIPSLVAQQVPVFQSLVQPLATHLPVTQSLCSTPPTVKDSHDGTDDGTVGRRKSMPETNNKYVQQMRRMMGQSYVGINKKEMVEKQPRVMGARCQSAACVKSSKHHCSSIEEADREIIFKCFWEYMNWKEKQLYVRSLVDVIPVQRRRGLSSRRSSTYIFSLEVGGRKRRVCKRMFLATLGIGEWSVLNWVQGTENTQQNAASCHRGEDTEFTSFLQDFPHS